VGGSAFRATIHIQGDGSHCRNRNQSDVRPVLQKTLFSGCAIVL